MSKLFRIKWPRIDRDDLVLALKYGLAYSAWLAGIILLGVPP
jgi:hypothetical protein